MGPMLPMNRATMRISVVIPCHNGIADTRACLQSLQCQVGAPELEILLVDNASQDGTSSLPEEFPGLCLRVLRQEQNLGFAGGVNQGLAQASGNFILILNNDTLAAPHLIARLLAPLLHDQSIALTAPVSNHVKGPAHLAVGDLGSTAGGRQELEQALSESNSTLLQDVSTLAGLCLMLRRELLATVGKFDIRFGLGNYEDDDFCLRTRLLGHRLVIVRDAFLHHHGHRTFKKLGLDYRQSVIRGEGLFREKWKDDAAGKVMLALLDEDLQAAAQLCPQAIANYPAWPDAMHIQARGLAGTSETTQAISLLEAYLQVCPQDSQAWTALVHQVMLNQGEEAGLETLAKSMAQCFFDPANTAEILSNHGLWLLHNQQCEKAALQLLAALEVQPESLDLQNLLGSCYLQMGNLDQAESHLHKAVEGGHNQAWINLGACQWRRGLTAQALQSMTRGMIENPGDTTAKANLDKALASMEAAGVAMGDLRSKLSVVGQAD